VRKHLSAISGGRLAAACAPATLVTLAVSDVVGDDPDVIASGPTVADASTFADALAVLDRYSLRERLPPPVLAHLQRGAATGEAESCDEAALVAGAEAGDARACAHAGAAALLVQVLVLGLVLLLLLLFVLTLSLAGMAGKLDYHVVASTAGMCCCRCVTACCPDCLAVC